MKPAAVSALDGSDGPVSDRLMAVPSLTLAGALKVAVGATLSTVTVKVSLLAPPSSSVTVKVTA